MTEIYIRCSYQTMQLYALYTAFIQIIEATRAKAHSVGTCAKNRLGRGGGGGGTRVTSNRFGCAYIMHAAPTAAGKDDRGVRC